MNTLPELVPGPGHYGVVSAPRNAMRLLLDMAARLALAGALRVLDCGNCFNVYTVTQALHQQTMDTTDALRRISVARAFTCYQVTTLLESTPQDSTPTLVLDLLSTFYDESVSPGERRRLLERNVTALRRLSQQGSVLVSIHPKGSHDPEGSHDPKSSLPGSQTGDEFTEILEEAAGQVWRFEPQAPPPILRLF